MAFIVPDDLDAAFSIMHLKQPQFAAFILSLPVPIHLDEQAGEGSTMYTDGKKIVVSKWFVDNQPIMETAAGLCHETLHVMYAHPEVLKRWGKARAVDDMPFYNAIAQIAFDLIVNDTLWKCGFDIPSGWCHDHSLGTWVDDELTVYRRVYEKYKDQLPPPGQEPQLGDGLFGVDVKEAADDLPDDNRKAAITRKAFADLDTSKLRGVRAGELERLIDRLTPTNVDWRAVVRPRIRTVCGADNHTWNSINKPAFAMHTLLPGKYGHRTGKMIIAADTSGSVTHDEQSLYLAALGEIFASCMPKHLWFLEIDTYVRRAREVTKATDLAEITCTNRGLYGGGGTRMPAIWNWLEEQKLTVDLMLVLTDMMTPFPTTLHPVKDVVWVSTSHRGIIAPIGRTTFMERK